MEPLDVPGDRLPRLDHCVLGAERSHYPGNVGAGGDPGERLGCGGALKRLILRREPLHPGAQTSLFPSLEYRYWGHYTDAAGDPVALDVHMRAHARVEDHIRRLKVSGLERFPFCDLDANRAWMAVVCFGADLVRWFQLLCVSGPLANAEPKALRWSLWRTPARIVRHARRQIVRILDGWPAADELLAAYRRIALIT